MPRLKSRLTFANVCSFLALLIALGTGSAYAANTVFSTDIVDGEVKTADLANNSVRSNKIGAGQVANADLGDGAVTSTKLGDGSVTNFKLGSGVVTHSKLGASSIDGSNVAAESLSLSDIVGANKSGAISFSQGANTCGNLNLSRLRCSGGPGRPVQLHGIDGHSRHGGIRGVRVTAANTVVVRACNVGASAVSVSDLGIRVVTFG